MLAIAITGVAPADQKAQDRRRAEQLDEVVARVEYVD